MLEEHIARSLTLEELASRLQDHDEFAVAELARRVIEALDRREIDEDP